ncbi:MAG: PTS sugar transporter subunit IIA, partial [Pseudomonadota bacterium]
AGFRASGKKAVIQRLCEAAAHDLDCDAAEIFDAVMERERLGSTGVGGGVAIPHARIDGLDRPRGWFARLDSPVDYDAIDDAPVDLVFLLLAPEAANAEHLKTLARISRFFRREDRRQRIRETESPAAIHALFAAAEKRDAA